MGTEVPPEGLCAAQAPHISWVKVLALAAELLRHVSFSSTSDLTLLATGVLRWPWKCWSLSRGF